MFRKTTLFLAMLLPVLLWSQTRVSQAYLGTDGQVLTQEVTVSNEWLESLRPSTINQMAGFPKKIPAHPNFKNFQNVTLADINGDGKEEILIATLNHLRVFKHDGTILWSKQLTGTPIYPPSVAVMNASGALGIVQVTGGLPNNGRVYYLDVTGNDMAGFPVSFTNHWILTAPTIADLNGDGNKEIIVQTRTSNNLHAIRLDGTILWTVNLGGTPAITPSVADIDNDGIMDVIAGTSNGILHAFNGNDGSIKNGFPVASENHSLSYQSPMLVDLDGNNLLSIVGSTHGNEPKYFVRKHDGTYRNGWPVPVPDNNWTYSPPTVVDLTGNNDFKIFVSRPISTDPLPMLFGFNPDGTLMPNFPIVKSGGLESFISVADITGDGAQDLIFASNLMVEGQGFIHAYKMDGTGEIAGFPLRPTGFTYMNGATLGDVNGDGMLDLVAFSYEQTFSPSDSAYVNVYELMIPVSQANVLFGTYKGSNDRTGFMPRSAGGNFPSPQNLVATASGSTAQLSWEAPALGKAGTTAPWMAEPLAGGQLGVAEVSEDSGHGVMPTGVKYNVGSQGRSSVLFDNGPFVNAPGAGPGGSDLSQLHSGMTTFGPSINHAGSIRVADDFTVTDTWNVENFTFYAYQTATHPNPPVSSITGAYMKIWSGMPDAAGSVVVYGDMTVNALTSTAWTNAYRVSATTPTNTQRPIMSIVCATPGLTLQPGTYYVEWSATGSIASGPWGVPVTINGQTTTGNALQFTTTTNAWVPLEMGGTLTGYGLSFLVEGTTGGGGGLNLTGYNIYRDGTLLGSTPATTTSYTDGPLAAGVYNYGVTAVYGAPDPGESAPVTASVTIAPPSGPVIGITPASLSATVQPNQSTVKTLTISNSGGAPLTYQITVNTTSSNGAQIGGLPEGTEMPVGADRSRATASSQIATAEIFAAGNEPHRTGLTEGFDDVTLLPAQGWAIINKSQPVGTATWFQGNSTVFPAHSGGPTSYIGANFNSTAGTGTISNWLLTPVFNFENGQTISFWTRGTGSQWPDRLEVRLSTSGDGQNVGNTATEVGTFTTLLLSVNPDLTATGYPAVWTQYTATISGLAAPVSGRIGFRYFVTNGGPNGSNSDFIGIDSFEYSGGGTPPPPGWLSASPLTGTVAPGASVDVSVTFDAAGLALGTYQGSLVIASNDAAQPSATVAATMNVASAGPAIAVAPAALSATVQPNQSSVKTLTISNNGGAPLTYEITVNATNSSGAQIGGLPRGTEMPVGFDRSRATASSQIATAEIFATGNEPHRNSFTEGFDDVTLLPAQGWAIINKSQPVGTATWFQGNSTVFPAHSGGPTSYIGANFNSTAGTGTISNWLLTPVFNFENGQTISFWTRGTGSQWPDRLEVRLSTSGDGQNVGNTATEVGTFTTLLLSVNPDLTATGYPAVWTQYTATISGLAAPVSGRIGFRYFVTNGGPNGSNSDFIGIDSFEYSGGGTPPPPANWLSASPLTGTVAPGASVDVAVTFNATGLALGTYLGSLVIASNDPAQPSVTVPATLNVAGPSAGLPFEETWSSGGFTANNWTFAPEQGNWRMSTAAGNPAPSVEFAWTPSTQNYNFALVSKDIDATAASNVVFKYDYFLDNYATSGAEFLKVYIWNGTAWILLDTYSNTGDIPWTTKTHNVTAHAAGKVTKVKFEASGATTFDIDFWRLDNISLFQPATIDLAAMAVTGNTTPSVGSATPYNVVVKNNGGAAQSTYTVKLMREGGVQIGSVAGPAIQPNETLNVAFSWTPAQQGATFLYGVVEIAGDENPANNTSPNLNVNVQPAGLQAITVGSGTTLPTFRVPFDFYYKNSLVQSLYYPDELQNIGGALMGISYYNNFITDLPNKPVKIWVGTTQLADLSTGWVEPTTLTLVYDGNVNFPIGANTVYIPFSQPYIYTGGNLVIYTQRVWEDVYFNINDKFYSTETAAKPNRTRHVQADATVYDPLVPPAPAATQLKNWHPNTTLFFNTAGLGSLQGVVNSGGQPLAQATVQVVGTSISTQTNAQGQYNFPYLLAGNINVTASKFGYVSQTQPATITADQTTTLNFTLPAMPTVTVSGFVAGNDAPTVGLNGAEVKLEGYQNYTVSTNASGQFVIPGVYANNTYTIKVSKAGYTPYQGQVVVAGSNLVVPNIILSEIILPPKNLTANISPTNPNLVQLAWNMIQDVEFRYDDGVSTGQLGFQSGTTNGVIGNKHNQSATIQEISWYLTSEGGPHNSIVIRILGLTATGLPNSSAVLYEATVSNVDGQWNTHVLPTPVVATGGFFLGAAFNGFLGIGTDDGVGAPWVFQDNTHFYNSAFTTGTWSTFESLGADFRRNAMIRAKGVPGAVASYAIDSPQASGEPMILTTGKASVNTGQPEYSTPVYAPDALLHFNVYKNNVLLATNVTEMNYSYTEMQIGQHCYHVKAVYGTGESAASNTACVSVLVGVNEQLEAATRVYPNPASSSFRIESLPMNRIVITNAIGQTLLDQHANGQTSTTLNAQQWDAGVYVIQIHTSEGVTNKRITIVK